VLEVVGLTDTDRGHGNSVLRGVSLSIHAGEIVALAGLAGAGRSETALAMFGARPATTGTVAVEGKRLLIRNVRDAIRAGIGYLPEDRKEAGLFLQMSIAENIAAASVACPVLHACRGSGAGSDRWPSSTVRDWASRVAMWTSVSKSSAAAISRRSSWPNGSCLVQRS
jgi:ABC-type sugar transport system ATPase subunit